MHRDERLYEFVESVPLVEDLQQRSCHLLLHRRVRAIGHRAHQRPVRVHQELLEGSVGLGGVGILGIGMELKELGADLPLVPI